MTSLSPSTPTDDPFSCVVMGGESLLVRCADYLRERGHAVQAVVSADRRVTSWCAENDIPCLDPGGYVEALAAMTVEYFFSIANQQVVPEAALRQVQEAAINFHDGPLPEYAGLNTPAWALINQERQHGVTWHVMTTGVDEGDIVAARPVDIDPEDTAPTLNTKCLRRALCRSRR